MKWLMREKFSYVDVFFFILIGRCISDGLYLYAAIIFGVHSVFSFMACYQSKELDAKS
jgi:hypothetical protein